MILPLFYKEPCAYIQITQHAIAINGFLCNTQRMVQQYVTDAYLLIVRVLRGCTTTRLLHFVRITERV